MASFSKNLMTKKLAQLNQSQESIETLSLWMLHYRKHAETIVEHWAKTFFTVSEKQKILFLFLANEIIKTSKEKSQAFREQFQKVLPTIFFHIGQTSFRCNLLDQTHRILNIWRDHGLFSQKTINEFWACLKENSSPSPIEVESYEVDDFDVARNIKKIFLTFEAPSPEKLIDVLESIYDLPSADKYTRNKIDAYSKKNLFEIKVNDTKEAAEYAEKLKKVGKLADNYNKLLELELKQRKKFHDMLIGYEEVERERIDEIEKKLEEIKIDLEERIHLREELQRHHDSLPDLEHFSNAMTLPPLPSAQDLFTKHAIN